MQYLGLQTPKSWLRDNGMLCGSEFEIEEKHCLVMIVIHHIHSPVKVLNHIVHN